MDIVSWAKILFVGQATTHHFAKPIRQHVTDEPGITSPFEFKIRTRTRLEHATFTNKDAIKKNNNKPHVVST